jgi:hypothetical protein
MDRRRLLIALKAAMAAAIGGALTGAAEAAAGGHMKGIVSAAIAGACMSVAHLFQEDPRKS